MRNEVISEINAVIDFTNFEYALNTACWMLATREDFSDRDDWFERGTD